MWPVSSIVADLNHPGLGPEPRPSEIGPLHSSYTWLKDHLRGSSSRPWAPGVAPFSLIPVEPTAVDEPDTPSGIEESPSDLDLFRGLRAGDPAVLRTLLGRYRGPLMGFAHRILGGGGDPQDVVQEAFIRLWTHRESWRSSGSIRAILFAITRNAALDELRKMRKKPQALVNHLGTLSDPNPDPLETTLESEMREAVAEAVSRLSPRRREVFRLVREDGLAYREVSEVLGISPQTVANLMSLALSDLRKALTSVLGGAHPEQNSTPAVPKSRRALGSD